MATVHPSRMALVPRDSRDSYHSRGRDPSPRHISHRDDDRRRDRSDERNRNGRTQERRSRSRGRSRENNTRRQSPEYSEYRRPKSPSPTRRDDQTPWRQEQNMYPNRRDKPGYDGGGSDYLESRRLQRENSSANVWPSSPKAPNRDLSPDSDYKRHKRSKRRNRSLSSDGSTDSSEEEERRRRERKHKKRARKDKDREMEERKDRSRRKSRRSYDNKDGERVIREDSHRRSSSEKRTKSAEYSPVPRLDENDEDEWVEKPVEVGAMAPPAAPSSSVRASEKDHSNSSNFHQGDEDSDMELGPMPAATIGGKATKRIDERQYGGALLRGEGSAMAAFLQEDTNVRIPRRGEIGLTSGEIATFEDVGYVMSGSRHKRMNAVRIRKENQVISAEERRGILKLQKEERERRETVLREEFQELMDEKLKGASSRTSAQ